jgi:hypothetical protein
MKTNLLKMIFRVPQPLGWSGFSISKQSDFCFLKKFFHNASCVLICSLVLILLSVNVVNAQTYVFKDGFNRATLSPG